MSRAWIDRLQSVWCEAFSLDSRSLAAARMGTGVILLVDLAQRSRDLDVFYTENGLLPRNSLIELVPSLSFPSLHLANDTLVYQAVLLTLNAIVALALLVGFHTRLSSVLAWLLLVSLHARNFYVLNTGDAVLAGLLFWMVLLPIGHSWSVDARHSGDPAPIRLLSGATVALVLQVVAMYLFAALHKSEPAWWDQGSAVSLALSNDSFARAPAAWLLQFPRQLTFLTWGILAWEYLAPVLLLWPASRLFAIAVCAAMHLGFVPFLFLGLFHWTPLLGLFAMLPGKVWRSRRAAAQVDRIAANSATLIPLLLCALVLVRHLEDLGHGRMPLLPGAVRSVVNVVAGPFNWAMFTGTSLTERGWFAIEVVTSSGVRYDMLADAPLRRQPPPSALALYKNQRWQNFMLSTPTWLPRLPRNDRWVDWWLQRWDENHPGDPAREGKVWFYSWRVDGPSGAQATPVLLAWSRR